MKRTPLVILPGWRLGSEKYLPLKKILEKDGYKVYVVDFPGFEKSKPLIKPLNLTDYCNFVKNYLSQKNIILPAIIAHSFGGRVALKLLKNNPKLAKAVILSGTPGYPGEPEIIIFIKKKLFKIASIILSIYPLCLFKELLRANVLKFFGAADAGNVGGTLKDTFNQVVEENLINYMKDFSLPTLLLWGEDDKLVTLKVARKMQQTIPKSVLKIIPSARHNFIYKDPEIFFNNLKPFLIQHDI